MCLKVKISKEKLNSLVNLAKVEEILKKEDVLVDIKNAVNVNMSIHRQGSWEFAIESQTNREDYNEVVFYRFNENGEIFVSGGADVYLSEEER